MAINRFGDRGRPWPGSLSGARIGDRLVAIFVLGVVLFSPLMMGIFDGGNGRTVLGIPLLYFYLFSAWALLIGLLAWVIERQPDRPARGVAPGRPAGDGDGRP